MEGKRMGEWSWREGERGSGHEGEWNRGVVMEGNAWCVTHTHKFTIIYTHTDPPINPTVYNNHDKYWPVLLGATMQFIGFW